MCLHQGCLCCCSGYSLHILLADIYMKLRHTTNGELVKPKLSYSCPLSWLLKVFYWVSVLIFNYNSYLKKLKLFAVCCLIFTTSCCILADIFVCLMFVVKQKRVTRRSTSQESMESDDIFSIDTIDNEENVPPPTFRSPVCKSHDSSLNFITILNLLIF